MSQIKSKPEWLKVCETYTAQEYREAQPRWLALRRSVVARIAQMTANEVAELIIDLSQRSDDWERRAIYYMPSDG